MQADNRAKSLRHLINVRLALTSLFMLILSSLIVVWQARTSVKNELESSLKLAAQLIQVNFPSQGPSATVNIEAWLSRFLALEQTRHLIIELVQPDGQVLSYEGKAKPKADRKPPDLFFRLAAAETPSIQQKIDLADGRQINLVVRADPTDEILEAWQESRSWFMILLTMTGMLFVIVNLLFKKTLHAINIIINNLKTIETGNYTQKLPNFAIQEYNQIARAINHLSGVMVAAQQENQALTRHTLKIQEDERKHLAKELHDELGQSITAIKVMAATSKNASAKPSEIADTIGSICDHLIGVVRSMMRNLHPLVLTELGLKAGLEDLLDQWSQRQPAIKFTLHCPDTLETRLTPDVSIQIFRICQECLTNIVRHAHASVAAIEIFNTADNGLLLTIEDNGVGSPADETKKSFGLRGIQERVSSLNGQLEIHASPQNGWTVIVRIPLP